jgi:alpha,alpha-trehalase
MDSPSVFGTILDRHAGGFRLAPADASVPAARRYVPGTMVLETSWQTPTGWLVVRDVLLMGPWHHQDELSHTHRRAPTDYDADHVMLRLIRCVNGEVQVLLDCEPSFDYGKLDASWKYTGEGYHEARASADGTEAFLDLTTDMNLGFEGPRATARTLMKEGDTLFVALSWSEHAPPKTYEDAYDRLVWTAHHWQHWLDHGEFPDHPWRTFLQRSALTLKGLSYAPTGALVAAPTTSLPESPGGERNWDYRYTWIRDATFTLWALHVLGLDEEADDFARFIADITSEQGDRLQIMYGIDGESDLTESTLDHLSGYGAAKPVRIGNAAFAQRQNDVWGALLDSLYIHAKADRPVPEDFWPVVIDQVEAASAAWREPDQGIWEARGEPKHYVSSKLMCWVALDRGARLARRRDDHEHAERWQPVADEIQAEILERGVSERGVMRQHFDTDALDASTLLAVLVRFLPPTHDVIRATVLAIADELTDHGLVLRYKVDQTDDGLSGEEGTFLICSFWLVAALSEIGEAERARALCEKLLSFAGSLGLYAEELDARSGVHLGNFPQAFTHLALINAVAHVIADDERAEEDDGPGKGVFTEMRAR